MFRIFFSLLAVISYASANVSVDHNTLLRTDPIYAAKMKHCPNSYILRSLVKRAKGNLKNAQNYFMKSNGVRWHIGEVYMDPSAHSDPQVYVDLPVVYEKTEDGRTCKARFLSDGKIMMYVTIKK